MAYENNLRGFKKWCKEHPWNSLYESEKEYIRFEDYFVEFSLNENLDKSLTAFCSIRKYNTKTEQFELVHEVEEPIMEKVKERAKGFVERNNCVSILY